MIPNDQPARRQMIDHMLDVVKDESARFRNPLTQWETEFIDSISTQFDTRGDLSDRQCEILEKIYDKC